MEQDDILTEAKKLSLRDKLLIGIGILAGVAVTKTYYGKTHIKVAKVNDNLVAMFLDGSLKAGDGSDKLLQYTKK